MQDQSVKLPYRLGVGIMMLNHDNKVFVGRRIDSTLDAWQMPQGGIDKNEDAKKAMFRELMEETGTNNIEIISESKEWFHYDLPKELVHKIWKGKYRGQKQKWFLTKFLGTDNEINIKTHHPEFNAWKWCNPDEILKYVVDFKRDLYVSVLQEFKPLLTDKKSLNILHR